MTKFDPQAHSAMQEVERLLVEAQRDARFHAMKHGEAIDRIHAAYHSIEHDKAMKTVMQLGTEIRKLREVKR